jgi:hypothetical protein
MSKGAQANRHEGKSYAIPAQLRRRCLPELLPRNDANQQREQRIHTRNDSYQPFKDKQVSCLKRVHTFALCLRSQSKPGILIPSLRPIPGLLFEQSLRGSITSCSLRPGFASFESLCCNPPFAFQPSEFCLELLPASPPNTLPQIIDKSFLKISLGSRSTDMPYSRHDSVALCEAADRRSNHGIPLRAGWSHLLRFFDIAPNFRGMRVVRHVRMKAAAKGAIRLTSGSPRAGHSAPARGGVRAPHFATTIREVKVSCGASNWWRAWEASPIVSDGETNSWRAWGASSELFRAIPGYRHKKHGGEGGRPRHRVSQPSVRSVTPALRDKIRSPVSSTTSAGSCR